MRILGLGFGSSEIAGTIAIETKGGLYLPLHDPFGHLAVLLDAETGKPLQTLRTTAFGESRLYEQEECPLSKTLCPWIISSKRYDPETGFILYGLRYYSPLLGRWITPDPAGFMDGPNLYAYVRNNPLIYTDLYGLGIFSSILTGIQSALPHLAARGGVALATALCPPLGVGLGVALTCYNVYTTGTLLFSAGSYLVSNIVTDGVGGGLLKVGTDALNFVNNCTSDQLVSLGASYVVSKGGGKLMGTKPMFPVQEKVGKIANGILQSGGGVGKESVFKNLVLSKPGTHRYGSILGSKRLQFDYPLFQNVRNLPAIIEGIKYSGHALDKMQDRGIMPSLVKNAFENGLVVTGKKLDTFAHYDAINNMTVISNKFGRVITVSHGYIEQ